MYGYGWSARTGICTVGTRSVDIIIVSMYRSKVLFDVSNIQNGQHQPVSSPFGTSKAIWRDCRVIRMVQVESMSQLGFEISLTVHVGGSSQSNAKRVLGAVVHMTYPWFYPC